MNSKKIKSFITENILVVFLLIMAILACFFIPYFFTAQNLLNVLTQIAINALLATGMTYVIITGGIDLSVGSVAALAGIVCTAIMVNIKGAGLAISLSMIFGVSLVVGGLCGVLVGLAVSKLNVAPFIATLSMMSIARGFAYVYTKSKPIFGLPDSFSWLGTGYISVIPVLGILMIIILLVAYIMENKTIFGRYIYAVGSNEEVAKLSGVKAGKVKLIVYVISGVLAALGGCCLASRLATGQPAAANSYELNAIAAVAMGGTSMSGGTGGIGKTVIGLITIGIINNSLSLLQVDSYWQPIAMGIIIFAAVAFDQMKLTRNKA